MFWLAQKRAQDADEDADEVWRGETDNVVEEETGVAGVGMM